jgi:hypothetical protein
MTAAAAAMLTTCHHASDRLSSSDSELGRSLVQPAGGHERARRAGRRVEEDLRGLLVELVGADPVDVLVEAGVGEDRLRRAGGGRGVQRSAMVPETSPAKKVMTSQSAIVARMVVEDRRLRVENRMATASHNEM